MSLPGNSSLNRVLSSGERELDELTVADLSDEEILEDILCG